VNRTSIEWTDFSANPLKYRDADGRVVWACVHASPGCKNCYSEALATRYRRGGPFNVPTMNELTPFLDEKELHHMLTAKTIDGLPVAGSKCFPFDMTDLFGEWVPDTLIDRAFAVFALRRDVTWQILTKRAHRMHAYLSARATSAEPWKLAARALGYTLEFDGLSMVPFPLPNVWLGVSCENQQYADERIPRLLQTPAAVRFISAEPLLGPINLRKVAVPDEHAGKYAGHGHTFNALRREDDLTLFNAPAHLDWVIPGGESASGARDCKVAWIRSLVRQCQDAERACFVKQLGTRVIDRNDAGFLGEDPTHWPDVIDIEDRVEHDLGGTRDGYQGAPVRIHLKDRKGGDPSEWPEDLRVREFPRVREAVSA
jgi:protein gp37